ncbi:phosphohydrolase [Macrococcus hajekii]|uniref:Phosphohydrolase n=1 Tax=Macrococcus hajekii TaxID=198482 RepID=A0A4V3BDY9_9STAP|nr:metallophosphoesterase [Macrococcus hajekii]TDM01984.1 phosphohydrolase [Macrococcus hajekii]GGB09055.1 phosphohydrolase [Macrococcus hajekii]
MNIGTISDIHIEDSQFDDYVEALVQAVRKKNIEMLLIAGDISSDHKLSYHFIKTLQLKLKIDIRFVPGNHDLWSQNGEKTTQIYQYFKSKSECLLHGPYIIGDYAIVGHCGWYDHSHASAEYTAERLERGRFKGGQWRDKEFVNWNADDKTISRRFAAETKQQLEQVKDKKIILMTHVVTHPAFSIPLPNRLFNFFNAFIGTSDYDDLYKNYPIELSIMGHVHFRKKLYEQGVHYICSCLGYKREWRTDNLKEEVEKSLYAFTINPMISEE